MRLSQAVSKRARALVREQLKDGPKPEAQIEAAAQAAAIPKATLIAAASVLGVRTQRGQWWIPQSAPRRGHMVGTDFPAGNHKRASAWFY